MLAIGLDPEDCILYIQSAVPQVRSLALFNVARIGAAFLKHCFPAFTIILAIGVRDARQPLAPHASLEVEEWRRAAARLARRRRRRAARNERVRGATAVPNTAGSRYSIVQRHARACG